MLTRSACYLLAFSSRAPYTPTWKSHAAECLHAVSCSPRCPLRLTPPCCSPTRPPWRRPHRVAPSPGGCSAGIITKQVKTAHPQHTARLCPAPCTHSHSPAGPALRHGELYCRCCHAKLRYPTCREVSTPLSSSPKPRSILTRPALRPAQVNEGHDRAAICPRARRRPVAAGRRARRWRDTRQWTGQTGGGSEQGGRVATLVLLRTLRPRALGRRLAALHRHASRLVVLKGAPHLCGAPRGRAAVQGAGGEESGAV